MTEIGQKRSKRQAAMPLLGNILATETRHSKGRRKKEGRERI
jgi:hypothetical protein